LLVLAAVGFVVVLNLTPVYNADFWIQLKVGDVIRETGEIPDTYDYTYTEARDESYIAPNWLACLTWSHLYRINGYDGMTVVKCLLALGLFGLIVLLSQQVGRDPNLAIALGCLTILGINFRILLRPELVGFLLALVDLICLHRFARSGKPQWLLGLVSTTLIWANFHPSFLLSFVFLACFAAEEVGGALASWKTPGAGRDWDSVRRRVGWLTAAALCMVAVTLVNPYGIHLVEHLLQVPDDDFVRENVWEWQSVFHPGFVREPFLFVLAATTVLAIVSGILGRRKLRAAPTLLALVFLPLALSAIRHVPWFEIVASYLLAHTLGDSATSRRWRVPVALTLSGVLLAGTWWVIENGNTHGRRPGFWNDAPLKPAVIEAIRDSPISGNVLHSYSYGDQLAYHFYPRIRIAMDTRIYPEKYYLEYRTMTGGSPSILVEPEAFREYLDRYDVRGIVTKYLNIAVSRLKGHLSVLTDEMGFKLVYSDRQTFVLFRPQSTDRDALGN
jgi:hypothetical protein